MCYHVICNLSLKSPLVSAQCSAAQCAVPGRRQLHADGQPGAEEARLSLPHELRQESAGHGHHGRQYLRQGRPWLTAYMLYIDSYIYSRIFSIMYICLFYETVVTSCEL